LFRRTFTHVQSTAVTRRPRAVRLRRDTFASLEKTCRKVGIFVRRFLADRSSGSNTVHPLADLAAQRAKRSALKSCPQIKLNRSRDRTDALAEHALDLREPSVCLGAHLPDCAEVTKTPLNQTRFPGHGIFRIAQKNPRNPRAVGLAPQVALRADTGIAKVVHPCRSGTGIPCSTQGLVLVFLRPHCAIVAPVPARGPDKGPAQGHRHRKCRCSGSDRYSSSARLR
jgi:hypothetical protein